MIILNLNILKCARDRDQALDAFWTDVTDVKSYPDKDGVSVELLRASDRCDFLVKNNLQAKTMLHFTSRQCVSGGGGNQARYLFASASSSSSTGHRQISRLLSSATDQPAAETEWTGT